MQELRAKIVDIGQVIQRNELIIERLEALAGAVREKRLLQDACVSTEASDAQEITDPVSVLCVSVFRLQNQLEDERRLYMQEREDFLAALGAVQRQAFELRDLVKQHV
jgi:hypothetical protein